MFKAVVIRDSIGPNGIRLTTMALTYPRFIHSELLTHRDRARNSASSRAIPWKKYKKDAPGAISTHEYEAGMISRNDYVKNMVSNCMYSMIASEPVVPIFIGSEKPGMQAGDELQGADREKVVNLILQMRDFCLEKCDEMAKLGAHKSIVNRYVEPWMWMTALYTATEWKNFFRLRVHPDAERHFNLIASMAKEERERSVPTQLKAGEWHLPYFDLEDGIEIARRGLHHVEPHAKQKISAGRCARLSYLTHEGKRDIAEDVKLAQKLIERPDDVLHASPLEHVAQASDDPNLRSGPFRGWFQFRKLFPNENVEG